MTGSMKFFLAGCVAELYLLIVRRYYTQGTVNQMLAWYDVYFKVFALLGAVLLIAGIVLFLQKKPVLRELSYYIAGAGAFLLAANLLFLW